MCLRDLSSSELIALSSSIAVVIGETLCVDEVSVLAVFLTSLGDNLAIIANNKEE